MEFPVVTQALALRVGRSEADHMAPWLEVIAAESGNPFGAEVRRLGESVALRSKGAGGASLGPLFNRVLCFSDADAEQIVDLQQFYRECGLGCRIDVNPYAVTAPTFRKLAAAGFCPFRYHAHLYGVPSVVAKTGLTNPDVTVRAIGVDEQMTWAGVWQRGFLEVSGIDSAHHGAVAAATARLSACPGWRLYLACMHGEPAAAAALYVQDGIGSLTMAGTATEFRRRGCQEALLNVRIADAAALGCDLVVAQAALGATSHHNMERAGLRVAYTRAFWFAP